MPKCAACGFITLRNRLTGDLDEMDADFRKTGNPPHREIPIVGGAGSKFALVDTTPCRHVPMCFALSVTLADEWPGTKELLEQYKDWPPSTMLEVITKERPGCEGKFTKWQQGFTPKEHREMLDRQWMVEREARLTKEMREREDRLTREVREREDKRDEAARTWQGTLHRREMLILGGLVTLAIILSTILGGMIEAGWIPNPRGDTTQPILIVEPSPATSDTSLTPTPSLGSTPGMASPQPQSTP